MTPTPVPSQEAVTCSAEIGIELVLSVREQQRIAPLIDAALRAERERLGDLAADNERLAGLLKTTRDASLVEMTADRDSWRQQAEMYSEMVLTERERTLEDAANAACGYCRRPHRPVRRPIYTDRLTPARWIHEWDDEAGDICHASRIWEMIRALAQPETKGGK